MTDESDVPTRAKPLYERAKTHWSEIHESARQDLHFLSDDKYAQWNQKDYDDRENSGRPVLTVDQLSQFVHQVSNDIRQNTPQLTVIPDGDEASQESAEAFKGLIRNIEYVSNADDAYDNAANSAVKCSIGYIRVDHDYCDEEGFDQELLVKRVINPLAVFLDPDSIECDGRDAKYAFIIDKITVSEFKRQFPGKDVSSFGESVGDASKLKTDDYVQIAEFFEIKTEEKTISVNEKGDIAEYQEGTPVTNKRTIKKSKVMRYKLSEKDELEKTSFPGKYIPLVPVYGEEAWTEGKRNLFSLIRKAKGAQMMYNVWKSLETEIIMKQPQAPVMVAEGQIEDYAADWKDPSKSMALRYKAIDANGNPMPAPQRLAPPSIPAGIVNASRETVDDIKATMGLYNASIGQRSNETSGVAIDKRKTEGDVATFHFYDNLVRSITHVYRILINAIPEIYDTARIIRVLGEEDEAKELGINGQMVEDQEDHIDLTKGKYSVKVIPGASYTTKRQEAAAFYTEVVTKMPELINVMGDLLFKNADFAGAPAMAERMKKVIQKTNPDLIEEPGKEPVDPQVMAMQAQMQQMQQVIQEGAQELQKLQQEKANKDGELQIKALSEQNKAQDNEAKKRIDALKLHLEELKLQAEISKQEADIALQNRQLDLQALTIGLDIQQSQSDAEQAVIMNAMDQDHQLNMQQAGHENALMTQAMQPQLDPTV